MPGAGWTEGEEGAARQVGGGPRAGEKLDGGAAGGPPRNADPRPVPGGPRGLPGLLPTLSRLRGPATRQRPRRPQEPHWGPIATWGLAGAQRLEQDPGYRYGVPLPTAAYTARSRGWIPTQVPWSSRPPWKEAPQTGLPEAAQGPSTTKWHHEVTNQHRRPPPLQTLE